MTPDARAVKKLRAHTPEKRDPRRGDVVFLSPPRVPNKNGIYPFLGEILTVEARTMQVRPLTDPHAHDGSPATGDPKPITARTSWIRGGKKRWVRYQQALTRMLDSHSRSAALISSIHRSLQGELLIGTPIAHKPAAITRDPRLALRDGYIEVSIPAKTLARIIPSSARP